MKNLTMSTRLNPGFLSELIGNAVSAFKNQANTFSASALAALENTMHSSPVLP